MTETFFKYTIFKSVFILIFTNVYNQLTLKPTNFKKKLFKNLNWSNYTTLKIHLLKSLQNYFSGKTPNIFQIPESKQYHRMHHFKSVISHNSLPSNPNYNNLPGNVIYFCQKWIRQNLRVFPFS